MPSSQNSWSNPYRLAAATSLGLKPYSQPHDVHGLHPPAATACHVADTASCDGVDIARRAYIDLLRIILSVLLPPLGVFLQVGIKGHFWLNILLTLLGYLPGVVHAVWVIAKK
mgnify:CR=1 FL=1